MFNGAIIYHFKPFIEFYCNNQSGGEKWMNDILYDKMNSSSLCIVKN